jgi:hypothetical protein
MDAHEILKLSPRSGNPAVDRYFGSCLADKSYRPDRSRTLPRSRTGTPPDARGRRSRSPARARLCSYERRPRHAAKSLAELVDANDRCSRASRWRVVASRAARVRRAHRRRGTEGSNPSPSSGESANHQFRGGADRPASVTSTPSGMGTRAGGPWPQSSSLDPGQRIRPSRRRSIQATTSVT